MKKLRYLLFILTILLSTTSYSMKLRPIGFDKRIDKGDGYQEFTVTNTSNEMTRYKVTISDTGKDTDISHLITVYPKVFTVEPQSEKTFKVYVEETELPKGEYNFILGIQPIKLPKVEEIGKGKTSGAISMRMAMAVEMMAYSGDLENKFDITNASFYENNGEKYYKANIKNNTGRGYELYLGFTDKMNNLIELKPMGRLFNGNGTKVDVKIPKHAVNIVFYDCNNYKTVCQKIKIK